MQLDLINNSGPIDFKDEIAEQLKTCNHFSIATAFITKDAIKLLNIFLSENKNNDRTGRLITGFYQCFNSRKDLNELNEMMKVSKGRLIVKISSNERFHWKLYNFLYSNKTISYIGSANFTSSGLTKTGELLAKLTILKSEKFKKNNLEGIFNKEWDRSVELSKIPLKNYKQLIQPKVSANLLDTSIKNILANYRTNKTKKDKETTNGSLSARVVLLKDYLPDRSKKIVLKTNADWKKYYYYPTFSQTTYNLTKKSDFLILIERYNRKFKYYIGLIKDDCILKTKDGKFFIAYKYKHIRQVQETSSRRNFLEGLGIDYHSHNFSEKSLGVNQTNDVLKNIFKLKKV